MTHDDIILNLSQSDDPWKRSFARLMASPITDAYGKWFVDEQMRGTSPIDVMLCVSEIISFMGSFAVKNCSRVGHEVDAARAMCDGVERSITHFFEKNK